MLELEELYAFNILHYIVVLCVQVRETLTNTTRAVH